MKIPTTSNSVLQIKEIARSLGILKSANKQVLIHDISAKKSYFEQPFESVVAIDIGTLSLGLCRLSLNENQHNGKYKPYMCKNCQDTKLVATTDGWKCPTCDYTLNYMIT